MIRRGIDRQWRELIDFTMLFHGDYNTFKTYLVGAFIATAIRAGKKALFWNVQGEDGDKTLAAFPEIDSKEHVWTLETAEDIDAAMEELKARPIDALGVDSGKLWADKRILTYTGGEDRPLRVPKGKGDYSQEWPLMHHRMERDMQALRQAATRVLITCPSDLSAHHLDPSTDTWTKQKRVTPNYPGNEATRSAGWFDYVGYCEVKSFNPGELTRLLHFEYSDLFSSRARVVQKFSEGISLPDCSPPYTGRNVWEIVESQIKQRLTGGGS